MQLLAVSFFSVAREFAVLGEEQLGVKRVGIRDRRRSNLRVDRRSWAWINGRLTRISRPIQAESEATREVDPRDAQDMRDLGEEG